MEVKTTLMCLVTLTVCLVSIETKSVLELDDMTVAVDDKFHYTIGDRMFLAKYRIHRIVDKKTKLLPDWLTFDNTTNLLYGIPQVKDIGTNAIRLKATCIDPSKMECQEKISRSFIIRVVEPIESADSRGRNYYHLHAWSGKKHHGKYSLNLTNQVVTPQPTHNLMPSTNFYTHDINDVYSSHTFNVDSSLHSLHDHKPTNHVYSSIISPCDAGVPSFYASLLLHVQHDLTHADLLTIVLSMSAFVSKPLHLISLSMTVKDVLTMQMDNKHIVTAGPGNVVGSLKESVELSWHLACKEFSHVTEFAKVIQHNIDVGRLPRELGRDIIAWYLYSDRPVSRRMKRNANVRNGGTRTPTQSIVPSTLSLEVPSFSIELTKQQTTLIISTTDVQSLASSVYIDSSILVSFSMVSSFTDVSTDLLSSFLSSVTSTQRDSSTFSISDVVSTLTPASSIFQTHSVSSFVSSNLVSSSTVFEPSIKTTALSTVRSTASSDMVSPLLTTFFDSSSLLSSLPISSALFSVSSTDSPIISISSVSDFLSVSPSTLLTSSSGLLSSSSVHTFSSIVTSTPIQQLSTIHISSSDLLLSSTAPSKLSDMSSIFSFSMSESVTPDLSTSEVILSSFDTMTSDFATLRSPSLSSTASLTSLLTSLDSLFPTHVSDISSLEHLSTYSVLPTFTTSELSSSAELLTTYSVVPTFTTSELSSSSSELLSTYSVVLTFTTSELSSSSSHDTDSASNVASPSSVIIPSRSSLVSYSESLFVTSVLSEVLSTSFSFTLPTYSSFSVIESGSLSSYHDISVVESLMSTIMSSSDISSTFTYKTPSIDTTLELSSTFQIDQSSLVSKSFSSSVAFPSSSFTETFSSPESMYLSTSSRGLFSPEFKSSVIGMSSSSVPDLTSLPLSQSENTESYLESSVRIVPTRTASSITPSLDSSVRIVPTRTASSITPSLDSSVRIVPTRTASSITPSLETSQSSLQLPATTSSLEVTPSSFTMFSSLETDSSLVASSLQTKQPASIYSTTDYKMSETPLETGMTMTSSSQEVMASSKVLMPSSLVVPTVPPDDAPVLQNSIDHLPIVFGKYFMYRIPYNTFNDTEDGNTRNLTLSISLLYGKAMPIGVWLKFNPISQTIYGIPLQQDFKDNEDTFVERIMLIAKDSQGQVARDVISLTYSFEVLDITHRISLTLDYRFEHFHLERQNLVDVAEFIAQFYGNKNFKYLTFFDVKPGSVVVRWGNNSLFGTICYKDIISGLFSRVADENGTLTTEFENLFKGFNPLTAQLELSGPCLLPQLTPLPPFDSPVGASDSDKMWIEILLPALVIILILVIVALVLLICCRHKKPSKEPQSDKPMFLEDRRPIIFPEELEMVDPSLKPKQPLILPRDYLAETPPAVPPHGLQEPPSYRVPEISEDLLQPGTSETPPPPSYGNQATSEPPPYRLPPPYYNPHRANVKV